MRIISHISVTLSLTRSTHSIPIYYKLQQLLLSIEQRNDRFLPMCISATSSQKTSLIPLCLYQTYPFHNPKRRQIPPTAIKTFLHTYSTSFLLYLNYTFHFSFLLNHMQNWALTNTQIGKKNKGHNIYLHPSTYKVKKSTTI